MGLYLESLIGKRGERQTRLCQTARLGCALTVPGLVSGKSLAMIWLHLMLRSPLSVCTQWVKMSPPQGYKIYSWTKKSLNETLPGGNGTPGTGNKGNQILFMSLRPQSKNQEANLIVCSLESSQVVGQTLVFFQAELFTQAITSSFYTF